MAAVASCIVIPAIQLWPSLASGAQPPASPQASAAPPPARVVPSCPPEQLSCGRQQPIVSDGSRRFWNEDFWLGVTFPRGSRVCLTRSGDAPHGFFARYGPVQDCAERPDRGPEFIAIYAEYNALFETSLRAIVPADCGPLSSPVRRHLGRGGLSFPHYRSVACQTPVGGGAIEISVHALAGPWQRADSIPGRSRAAVYFATLGTTPAQLDADLIRFRRVLGSVQISSLRDE
ncbi:MAG TPA: hypothetical protein VK614_02680 [Allosphingosinicella sp.]|nr:hypothetical protein [Allosphingosinicella sp.]